MMETFFEEETISYAKVSECVSKLLDAMATQFHQQLSQGNSSMQYLITVFDSHTVPDILLSDYLHRIASMSKCSNRDMVAALVYVDKLINNEIISGISFHNVHRLLGVAIMISSKFFEDQSFSNKSWSKIVGIPLRELNAVESHFLQALGFDLHIDLETVQGWAEAIFRFADELPVQERLDSSQDHVEDQNCSESTVDIRQSVDTPIDL